VEDEDQDSRREPRAARTDEPEVAKPSEAPEEVAYNPAADKPLGPAGPSRAELETLKRQAGDIYTTPFSRGTPDEMIFVWRQITYLELTTMRRQQRQMAVGTPPGQPPAQEFDQDSYILGKCLLWPKLDRPQLLRLGAGIPTTLVDHIMGQSGFETWEPPIKL